MKKNILTLILTCAICYTAFAQKTDTLTTATGLKYYFIKKGDGPSLTPGWVAIWNYKLTLLDGTKIDATADRGVPFAAQYRSHKLIAGADEALSLMHVGDRGIFIMPYTIAYGVKGTGPIPPKATLVFDMELLDTKPKSLTMVLDSVLYPKSTPNDSVPQMDLVLKTFKQQKRDEFKAVYVSEDDLNAIGYELIKKYPADAVTLFKLNVGMYPKSWNAYDSLAEGYMDMGKTRLAIKNYEKSLKLNPKNTNGEDMLKKLRAPAAR